MARDWKREALELKAKLRDEIDACKAEESRAESALYDLRQARARIVELESEMALV